MCLHKEQLTVMHLQSTCPSPGILALLIMSKNAQRQLLCLTYKLCLGYDLILAKIEHIF